MDKLSYKSLFIIVGFLLISIVLLSKISKPGRQVFAAWYDVSWGYRKPITLSNSGTTLTDEDVLIQMDTASLISAGKLQSNCNDLRVADSDETTLISYWVEAGCNTASTQIWAQIPSLPNGGKTIYVYYSNSGAANAEQAWSGTFTLLNAASCPTGWTRNTNFDSKFPYGSTTSGTTGGSSSHAHAQINTTTDIAPQTGEYGTGCGNAWRTVPGSINGAHTNLKADVTTNSTVLPPYLDMVYCEKSKLDLKSGLISLFNTSTPTGWTRFTALDTNFPRGNSTYGGTGGSTTHTHTFTGGYTTSASNGTVIVNTDYGACSGSLSGAAWDHTHVSNGGLTASGNNTPPYLDFIFGSINADGIGQSNMIVLASATPPLGWTRFSALDNTFPRGNSSSGGSGGSSTHTHSITVTTGTNSAVSFVGEPDALNSADDKIHTHTATTTTDSQSNLPPFYSTIFAQRKTPSATTSSPGTEAAQPVSTPTLLLFFKFNEGTGLTINDSSGSNNPGIATSTTWNTLNQCISSSCLNFNGTNSVVTVANSLSTIKTISFWVKPTTTTEELFSLNGSAYVNLNSGTITPTGFTSASIYVNGASSSTLTAGTWQHVTITTTSGITGSAVKLGQIGSGYGQLVFDEFKIYNYLRSATEIKQDYNLGAINLGNQNTAPIKNSLVGYWKFDEGAGTTVYNSGIGGTINGTFGSGTSAPTWTNGKINKGLSFDGTSDYLTMGSNSSLQPATALTFSMWVNPTAYPVDYYAIGGMSLYGNARGYLFDMNTTGLYFYIGDGSWANAVTTSRPALNTWSHIAGTWDGSTIKLYINGILLNSASKNAISYTSTIFDLGRYGGFGTHQFNGQIDEVKIYNYALSSDEVKQDYNQGATFVMGSSNQTIGGTTTSLDYCVPGDTSPCSPPIAEYKFEEGTGTTAFDTSGNGYNGLLNNNTWAVGKIGKGLSFNGTSSFVSLSATISSLKSISFWVKPNTTTQSLIDFDGGTHSISVSSGAISATGFSIPSIYINGIGTSSGLTANTWSHITVTTSTPFNATSLTIGKSASNYFSGSIDQVRIYNYVRTPAQVAYDYNKGAPTGWWKFDECQGSVANDSSGIGNSGSIIIGSGGTQNSVGTCATASTAWGVGSTGKTNSSLNFDGTDDYVSVPAIASIIPVNHSRCAWIKSGLSNANYGSILDTGNAADTVGAYLMLGTGYIRAGGNNGSGWNGLNSTNLVNDNTWHHACIVFTSGTTAAIYVDGTLNITGTVTYSTTNSDNTIIGRNHAGNIQYFQGLIDDVRLYNYPLTSTQIKTIYNGGAVNFR